MRKEKGRVAYRPRNKVKFPSHEGIVPVRLLLCNILQQSNDQMTINTNQHNIRPRR